MSLQLISETRCFDGRQQRFSHTSQCNQCDMHFSIFLPATATANQPVPIIYWLSGLTCTDENFVQKAGAQQFATKYQVAIVAPDTSPRGKHVPDDENKDWDFGLGAGFYVDASEAPWCENYQMYSYITRELPALINQHFPIDSQRQSIMGHSMGGHGALTIALKHPEKYAAVSAFAPICSPSQCPWGQKAFSQYLGSGTHAWQQYDTTALLQQSQAQFPILVDQGTEDSFLHEQLKPELLEEAGRHSQHPVTINMRAGYDHTLNRCIKYPFF